MEKYWRVETKEVKVVRDGKMVKVRKPLRYICPRCDYSVMYDLYSSHVKYIWIYCPFCGRDVRLREDGTIDIMKEDEICE